MGMEEWQQSAPSRAWEDTKNWLQNHFFAWILAFLLPGVGTMLATLYTPASASVIKSGLYGFSGGIAGLLLLMLGTYLVHTIITPYGQRNEARTNIKQLQTQHKQEIAKLQQELEPKLRMFFSHDDPSCEQIMPLEGGGIRRLFRVGIENKGGTTVEGVQVKLENTDPPDSVLSQRLPAQLHRMHDNPSDEQPSHWETEFPMRSQDVEHIDVVEKCEREHSDLSNVIRFWLKPLGLYPISCRRYTIALAAHAYNSMECTGKFVVDVNEKGHLSFEQLASDKECSQS
jgi:hypothetical protein